MVSALAFDKGRKGTLLVIGLFRILGILSVFRGLLSDNAPPRLQYFLTGDLKLHILVSMNDAYHCCRRELAVGQEDTDKATGHEVVDFLLSIAEVLGNDTCGDNSVVVGDL